MWTKTAKMQMAALMIFAPFQAAHGARPAASEAAPLRDLQACKALQDPAARLECYDRSVEQLSAAIARKDVVVMGQADIAQTRRSLFGFSVPRLPLFGGDNSKDIDEIASTIAQVRDLGMGKWQVRLAEDGGVWQTTESGRFMQDPRAGQKIVIKRGALGNYFLRIDGNRGVPGRRVS
ncbi:MAG TPA: hypothetical protein VGC35_08905 [Allosphingosinicella sp.]